MINQKTCLTAQETPSKPRIIIKNKFFTFIIFSFYYHFNTFNGIKFICPVKHIVISSTAFIKSYQFTSTNLM